MKVVTDMWEAPPATL